MVNCQRGECTWLFHSEHAWRVQLRLLHGDFGNPPSTLLPAGWDQVRSYPICDLNASIMHVVSGVPQDYIGIDH
jgi:hypothetical protein